jgi:hypothetical protein
VGEAGRRLSFGCSRNGRRRPLGVGSHERPVRPSSPTSLGVVVGPAAWSAIVVVSSVRGAFSLDLTENAHDRGRVNNRRATC